MHRLIEPSQCSSAEVSIDQIACRFYAGGYCTEGPLCLLPHVNESKRVPDVICRYFLKGHCKFGCRCLYDHVFFKERNEKIALQLHKGQVASRQKIGETNFGKEEASVEDSQREILKEDLNSEVQNEDVNSVNMKNLEHMLVTVEYNDTDEDEILEENNYKKLFPLLSNSSESAEQDIQFKRRGSDSDYLKNFQNLRIRVEYSNPSSANEAKDTPSSLTSEDNGKRNMSRVSEVRSVIPIESDSQISMARSEENQEKTSQGIFEDYEKAFPSLPSVSESVENESKFKRSKNDCSTVQQLKNSKFLFKKYCDRADESMDNLPFCANEGNGNKTLSRNADCGIIGRPNEDGPRIFEKYHWKTSGNVDDTGRQARSNEEGLERLRKCDTGKKGMANRSSSTLLRQWLDCDASESIEAQFSPSQVGERATPLPIYCKEEDTSYVSHSDERCASTKVSDSECFEKEFSSDGKTTSPPKLRKDDFSLSSYSKVDDGSKVSWYDEVWDNIMKKKSPH